MKERPILFNNQMVRAILDGRKTQSRRILKPQPFSAPEQRDEEFAWDVYAGDELSGTINCPYGQPGDRLWVREAWSGEYWLKDVKPKCRFGVTREDRLVSLVPETWYWADGSPSCGDWEKPRPSIHMPRWASRITLEITDVRVDRLKGISQEDALSEGVTRDMRRDFGWACMESEEEFNFEQAKSTFKLLWESINGSGSWKANPWVWVVEFKKL